MAEGGHQSSFSSAQTVPLTDDHTQRRYNACFCNPVNYYTTSPILCMYMQSYGPNSMVCQYVGLSVCHTSEPCKNGWTDRDAVWVEDSGGPREPCIRWGSRYIERGNFVGKKRHCKYGDFLSWAVQERLNRLICRLDCGLGWAERIVFARWRQCAHMGRHIGATWQIWLKRPSAAAIRSNVKLLWPRVGSSFPIIFVTHIPISHI